MAALHHLEQGRGMPVLLLHAFPLSASSFAPQFAGLAERYRLIAPDMRGFGESPLLEGPIEMSEVSDDSIALLDRLGIARAAVVGVQTGGYAAMELAASHPERLLGLVLANTHPHPANEAGRVLREEAARAVLSRGSDALVEALYPKLLGPSASAALRDQVLAWVRAASPEAAAATHRGLALRRDARPFLSRHLGPTLLICGEHDRIAPPERAEEMANLMPNARLERIPGVGCLAHLEAPERFNAILDGFLSTLSER